MAPAAQNPEWCWRCGAGVLGQGRGAGEPHSQARCSFPLSGHLTLVLAWAGVVVEV